MGYLLQIDEDEPQPLASNMGMEELRKWAEGLEHKDYMQLSHLFAFGWSQKPADVQSELKQALKESPPARSSTLDTAKNMQALLKGVSEDSVVVSISGGMGKGEE